MILGAFSGSSFVLGKMQLDMHHKQSIDQKAALQSQLVLLQRVLLQKIVQTQNKQKGFLRVVFF